MHVLDYDSTFLKFAPNFSENIFPIEEIFSSVLENS